MFNGKFMSYKKKYDIFPVFRNHFFGCTLFFSKLIYRIPCTLYSRDFTESKMYLRCNVLSILSNLHTN